MTRNVRNLLTGAAAVLFISSGTLHFLQTRTFIKIVPPYLPEPRLLVYISGMAEIAGGIGLLLPRLRKPASWGLCVLLVAVFPANVYMATNSIQVAAQPLPQWALWARLPLQGVLIWWVLSLRPGKKKTAGNGGAIPAVNR